MRRFQDTPRGLRRSGSTLLLWRNYLLNTWKGKKKHYKVPSLFIIEIFMKIYKLLCFFIIIFFFRFSEVFNTVSKNSHDDIFYEDDIWPGLDQNG